MTWLFVRGAANGIHSIEISTKWHGMCYPHSRRHEGIFFTESIGVIKPAGNETWFHHAFITNWVYPRGLDAALPANYNIHTVPVCISPRALRGRTDTCGWRKSAQMAHVLSGGKGLRQPQSPDNQQPLFRCKNTTSVAEKTDPNTEQDKKNLYTESCQCRLRLPWIRAFDHQIVTAPKMRFQHSCYGLSVFREHRISFAHPVCAFPVAAGERRQCRPTPRTHDWIPAKKCPRFLTHSTKPRACLNRTPIVRRTPPL